MKVRKRLGNTLTCLGGIVLFIGILAYFLPKINNQQLQLVIQSFRTPTDHWLLQLMNKGMTGAMDHSLPVIVIGAAVLLLGILLICSVRSQPAVQSAPQPQSRAVHAPVAVQANPFARGQQQREEEGNPFARYIAADTVAKSIPVADEVQPVIEAAQQPQTETAQELPAEDAAAVYYPLQADEEETGSEPETFYGLIDEESLSDDDDDDDDEDDEDDEGAYETETPVLIAQPVYDPGKDFYMLDSDEPEDEEPEETTTPEAVEMPEEIVSRIDAPQEPVLSPAEEAEAEPESLREKAEEAKQNAKLQAAAGGLRPAIRSTFRKTTPAVHQAAAGENADAQPVSRIKSTMGHKR